MKSSVNRGRKGFGDAGEQTKKRERESLFLSLSMYPHVLLHPLPINAFFPVPLSSSSSLPHFLSPARKGQPGRGATAAVTVPGPLLGQTPRHRRRTARRASPRDPCGAPRKLKDYSRSVPGASRSDEPVPSPPSTSSSPRRRSKEVELAF